MLQVHSEEEYGIDWNAPLGIDDDAVAVEIPATENPLTPTDYTQLQQLINPSTDPDNHGITQYLLAMDLVQQKVSQY